MKKILTLFTALILFGSMTVVQATTYTVAGTMNGWSTSANPMSQVGTSDIYTATFSSPGTGEVKFKVVTDNNWDNPNYGSAAVNHSLSNIGMYDDSGNAVFQLSNNTAVTIYFDAENTKIYVRATVAEQQIISKGTTIYYDFTAYNKGINLFDGTWKEDVSSRIEVTLEDDWYVSAESYLFKSYASGWNFVKCTDLPTVGQNMIVSTDGSTYHWATYPPAGPSVKFDGLPTSVYKDQTVTFAATSENVEHPTYTFQVKKGEDEYGPDVTEYKFDEAGTYKVKVEVREEGASTVLDAVEQVVTCTKYSLMLNDHTTSDKGSEVAVFSSSDGSVFTATWNCASAGMYYFYASTNTSADAHSDCDYLNAGKSFTDGDAIQIYLYGDATGCYNHSFALNAPRAGEYTFTLTLGGTNSFKCDYPAALAAEVSFGVFPANIYKGQELNLNNYVSSENVTTPAYTFYLDDVEIADPAHFSVAAAGSHGLKVEVREAGETGDALATSTTTLEIKTLYLMQTDGTAKGTQVEECATTDGTHFTASWTCSSSTDVYFYVTNNPASDAHSSCDYLGGGTLANGTAFNAYLYGSSDFEGAYGAAYKLASPWNGEYVFTLTFNAAEPHSFKCDFPAEPEPEYTVLGEVPGLNWTLTSTVNNMTKTGGVYMLALTDVELAVGNYEFKIARNHSWAVAYPQEGNDKLSITEAGVYDVTFTLDLAASPEQSVNAVFKQPAVVIPTIKMRGTFAGGSSWSETAEFTLATDQKTASLTIANLPKGDYQFLVLSGASYLGNGHKFHRDYTSASGIDSNAGDMLLEADVTGNYTFTWTYEGNVLNIDFPACDYYLKNKWMGGAWNWKGMTDAGGGTYRLENVVYGGQGVNFNTSNDDAGATWKAQSVLFYEEGGNRKNVTAYDTVNFVLNPAADTVWAEMIHKDVTVYTVAGDQLALFSLGWTPSHPYKYTDMQKQEDGNYKWTNMDETAVLPAGTLKFKVIKDRAYENGSWPASDFEYEIQRSGEYEIAINFNPYSKDIWVDTTLLKAINVQDFSISGFGDWTTKHEFTRSSNNNKALVTLPLTAGDYEFKLIDADDKQYGNGQAFTRTNASIREIKQVDGGTAMTIHVDKDGDYLFSYIFETEQLVVSYPVIVPTAEKIAPLSGKFTINTKGDTVIFARGNLQYNYGANVWYTAEKQYEVLGDLNLRFGDASYTGSVDLFDWSCESSNFGLLASNVNADYTGAFVDWGQKFAGDEKEWGTLSLAEWQHLLGREKGGKSLWTILAVVVGPDTLLGMAIFPDDWTAPSGLTIKYGYYDLDNAADYVANSFALSQWEQMEAAGAVFLPFAGARAGWWGNKVGIDGKTIVSEPLNPLADSTYCWVDNVNEMAYYWLSTTESAINVKTAVFPGVTGDGLHWAGPQIWGRARRYGQPVRLVTRIPKAEFEDIRTGLTAGKYYTVCWNKTMVEIRGASLWSFIGKDVDFAYIQEESAPYPAGKPFIIYAESEKLEAILAGAEVTAPNNVGTNGLYGTFAQLEQNNFDDIASTTGKDVYFIYNEDGQPSKLRKVNGQTGNWIRAYRAYVIVADIIGGKPASAPGKKVRSMPMQKDAAQGFENIQTSDKPLKVLIDGTLYILRGENVYNANGQIVK